MPHFTTADGTRLAYEDYGTGEPIVFVASWVLDADMSTRSRTSPSVGTAALRSTGAGTAAPTGRRPATTSTPWRMTSPRCWSIST
jgi:hypothetical protein